MTGAGLVGTGKYGFSNLRALSCYNVPQRILPSLWDWVVQCVTFSSDGSLGYFRTSLRDLRIKRSRVFPAP
jgi:hypothetical protein